MVTIDKVDTLIIEQINDISNDDICHCEHKHYGSQEFVCGHDHCENFNMDCACEKEHMSDMNINGCFLCTIN